MLLVLNFILALALAGIVIRAWALRVAGKVPWFLVWVGSLGASWLMGWTLPAGIPLEAWTARLLVDTVGRAMAFGEMAGLLVEERPGVLSGVRWALVVLLASATGAGVWFAWPNLAEIAPAQSSVYSAAVILQRFTGFGLLVFVAGFLAFLAWLGLPVSSFWRWHSAAMTVMLLSALLPDVAYAESLLESQGVSITKASLVCDFTGAFCWLWGARRGNRVRVSGPRGEFPA